LVKRLDKYLSGSPMAGLGRRMVEASVKFTGGQVNPKLCAAVAEAESSRGRSPRAQGTLHDPFGMLTWTKDKGGFKDFGGAIDCWMQNIIVKPSWAPWQTGYDIQKPPTYCWTNVDTYAKNVTGVVNSI